MTRLAQVVSNLLNNASRYTDRGGQIRLSAEQQASDAVITVEDNGMGIPAHMLRKVFDMFTQVDRSLERSQGGLGLGLSLVQRLVELHSGSVAACSEGVGRGSNFVVRLPVEPSAAGRRADAAGDESVRHSLHRRILVVDDNHDAAASLALLLRVMGNETETSHDGLEALEVAAAFRPDEALLDIGMPKLNGYEVCRRIRQQAWGTGMALFALTGWGQEEDQRRSLAAGLTRTWSSRSSLLTLKYCSLKSLPPALERGPRGTESRELSAVLCSAVLSIPAPQETARWGARSLTSCCPPLGACVQAARSGACEASG